MSGKKPHNLPCFGDWVKQIIRSFTRERSFSGAAPVGPARTERCNLPNVLNAQSLGAVKVTSHLRHSTLQALIIAQS
jgi:hypothetical protein